MTLSINGVNGVQQTRAAQSTGYNGNNSGIGVIPIGKKTEVHKQQEALKNFSDEVKGGNVKYEEPNWFLKLLGAENRVVITVDDKNTTLGEIKGRLTWQTVQCTRISVTITAGTEISTKFRLALTENLMLLLI